MPKKHRNSVQSRSQNAEKIRKSKWDYCIKQWFSTITSLLKMGTSLKGKTLLPEGANSFLLEQFPFLKVWKITFTTIGELLWVLLYLLRTCVYCVMWATPMVCCVLEKDPFYNSLLAYTLYSHGPKLIPQYRKFHRIQCILKQKKKRPISSFDPVKMLQQK